MPYITNDERMNPDHTRNTGNLNYKLTNNMLDYIRAHGGPSYRVISEALSACHEAECELRRRLLTPYEEVKRCNSGDLGGYREMLAKMPKRDTNSGEQAPPHIHIHHEPGQ